MISQWWGKKKQEVTKTIALIQLVPLVLMWIYYMRRPQVGETAPPGVQMPKRQAA